MEIINIAFKSELEDDAKERRVLPLREGLKIESSQFSSGALSLPFLSSGSASASLTN